MKERITIVDYGLGNLASIKNMIKKVGGNSIITSDVEEIDRAEKIILPGVGSFHKGMQNLRESGLIDILNKKVIDQKTPILGICLGMQLLTQHSEEGNVNGLGWVNAKTVLFDKLKLSEDLKVPHMGWSDITVKSNEKLFSGEKSDYRFYHVHSYHVMCESEDNVMCTSNCGYEFVSGVVKDNIMGVQFHPEKSHKYGMQLMSNFINKF